jgi:hypothetical protein
MSIDLNRCPKGTSGAGHKTGRKLQGLWTLVHGCTQAVIVVWLQSTTSVIHPRCCLCTRLIDEDITPMDIQEVPPLDIQTIQGRIIRARAQ